MSVGPAGSVAHRRHGAGRLHVLVMAKAPVAGKVKTRLCPPLDHRQAAQVARACLVRTLEAVAGCSAGRKLVALDGEPEVVGSVLDGFEVFPQRGSTFAERLTNAWADAGGPGLQIGMDTPQVTSVQIDRLLAAMHEDPETAVLGPALDGGWWCIGTGQGWSGDVFSSVPMSSPLTGAYQLASLEAAGHAVRLAEAMRDIDTFDDAVEVTALVDEPAFRAEMLAAGVVAEAGRP